MEPLIIRPAVPDDVRAITAIYNDAILHTTATFDTEPGSEADRRVWLEHHGARHPVRVAEREGEVIGWASLSAWSERPAYDGTAEISVYVRAEARGHGVGRQLMEAVLAAGREAGVHTVLSRIAGDSPVSVHLHEVLGFEHIGVMKEVGRKFGQWVDVVIMQKMLDVPEERREPAEGDGMTPAEPRYRGRVAGLLTYGKLEWFAEWPDYLELGFGPEDVPELIRMATDEDLNFADSGTLEVWAPVHAWRALGQLHAVEAVEPLLRWLRARDENDDDWYLEEIPRVMELIGPPALRALRAYLSDPRHPEYPREACGGAIRRIGQTYPESRAAAVDAFAAQLRFHHEQDHELNAFLVIHLMELRAVEHAALIEEAYAASSVDETVCGTWGDVRRELGVSGLGLAPDEPEHPHSSPFSRLVAMGAPLRDALAGKRRKDRKRERQARKRNRRKKR